MLLDGETFDLVQHIDTVLAAVAGPRARAAHQLRADAVGARGRDARLPHARGRRGSSSSASARYVTRRRAGEGPARRLGRHASVLALRAPADHGQGPLPRARRPDAVHRAARADLRDARARRGRRPGEGDPGRQRAHRPPRTSSSRSRRARRSGAASRPASARRATWSSPPSRARARRRASATTPTTRRS